MNRAQLEESSPSRRAARWTRAFQPHAQRRRNPTPAQAPAPAKAAADGGAKEAPAEEAWRTADPYAFLTKPHENNMVHTTVHFRCGAAAGVLRCAVLRCGL